MPTRPKTVSLEPGPSLNLPSSEKAFLRPGLVGFAVTMSGFASSFFWADGAGKDEASRQDAMHKTDAFADDVRLRRRPRCPNEFNGLQ